MNHDSNQRAAIERSARAQHQIANAKQGLAHLKRGFVQLSRRRPMLVTLVGVSAGVLMLALLSRGRRAPS
jgi:hypothetical protein